MSAQSNQPWLLATRPPVGTRVTLADVAREAGVNKGTASRALRGMPGVGAGTRARIMAAAESLDYSASHIAIALSTGQTRTVGILLPTLRSWYFSEVAAGASEVLIPAGFRVELINLDLDPDFINLDPAGFRRLFREFSSSRGWEVLLFASTMWLGNPVSTGDPTFGTVPGLTIDNRGGCRAAARHLARLGHRTMVVLEGRAPGKSDVAMWEQRTLGFLDGTREAGLPDPVVLLAGDATPERGEEVTARLLAAAEPMPTAIFCHTDELAFGVLATLRRAGVRCPDDVSVMGFDDHPMARLWDLTTISQHAHEQGIQAGVALIDLLGGSTDPSPSPPRLDLEVALVVRRSTGRARP